jgi:hypothetical protein
MVRDTHHLVHTGHHNVDDDMVTVTCRKPESSEEIKHGATPGTPQTARDAEAPTVAFRLLGTRRLGYVMARGLLLRAMCSERCTLSAALEVNSATAERLRVPRVLARTRQQLRGRAAVNVVVRPTARVARRLKSSRRLRVVLVIRTTDTARNTRTFRKRLTLRR